MKIKNKYYFIMFHEGLNLYLFGERGFHVASVTGEKWRTNLSGTRDGYSARSMNLFEK